VMKDAKLDWRRVGKADAFVLVHVGALGDRHAAGEWEMLALSEKALTRTSRTRLTVRLEIRAVGVRLEPLELVAYGNRVRTLERMAWTEEGDTYRIDLESKSFPTNRLEACTLRITTKGRGSFEILERKVSATRSEAATAPDRTPSSR